MKLFAYVCFLCERYGWWCFNCLQDEKFLYRGRNYGVKIQCISIKCPSIWKVEGHWLATSL